MKPIKGVILAGGLGTRLFPLTKVTNKHLLPVYDEPMIYYPIRAMVEAGIDDISLVTGGNHAGEFLRLIGDGQKLGLKSVRYVYQEGEGGIAEALGLVQRVVEGHRLAVMLGDNIFQSSIKPFVDRFRKQKDGAFILLKKVKEPQRFGVATVENGRVVQIDEKPKKPRSSHAVTGLYLYDEYVFRYIRNCKPSARGELEITDVNNQYIKAQNLHYGLVKGWWTDCGTFESLYHASTLIEKEKKRK